MPKLLVNYGTEVSQITSNLSSNVGKNEQVHELIHNLFFQNILHIKLDII